MCTMSRDCPFDITTTLDMIEREAAVLSAAKAKATLGRWYQGAWFAQCLKHVPGQHKGLDDPLDPCEIVEELTADGDHLSCVSTPDRTLIGSDSQGPILSPADAEFIVLAKNSNLDSYVRALVAEVRRLLTIVETDGKSNLLGECLKEAGCVNTP